MTEKLYTQAEADALIAGAYLAVDALISKGWHSDQCASLRNQWHIDDPEACDCWNGLLRASVRELPPDAARLALEERLLTTLKAYNITFIDRDGLSHVLPCDEHRGAIIYPQGMTPIIQTGSNTQGVVIKTESLAEREAKLIADTRLEEAEWWNQRQPLWSDAMSKEKRARLATLRAAVQPGG